MTKEKEERDPNDGRRTDICVEKGDGQRQLFAESVYRSRCLVTRWSVVGRRKGSRCKVGVGRLGWCSAR